jgi:hypothetical protein
MAELVVGRLHEDHIGIRILRRMHPEASDYWDGNWVASEISVHIPPWRATYPADLRTEEFSHFRDQLSQMHDGVGKEASFDPMEPWLRLTLKLDELGHIEVTGDAGPEGLGKFFGQVRLDFRLTGVMDQTDLRPIITQLDEVARQFPTKGHPTDLGPSG